MKRSLLMVLIVLFALAPFTALAEGKGEPEFPTRRIQWVFPWQAGIPVHTHAQLTAEYLSKELGVEITITAMPGGGGTKSANYVLNQPADGYTVWDGWVAPLVFAGLVNDVGFTYEQFAPIGGLNRNPWTLVVRTEQPFDTLEEFIEYAREHPGMKYNSGGEFVVPHAAAALFLKEYGIKAIEVPYPGLAAGFPDFLSGVLDFTIAPPVAYEKTYTEQMKPLCVFQSERHPLAPEVPTAAELGYPPPFSDAVSAGWNYIVVRIETPQERVKILQDALRKVVNNEEYQKACADRFMTLHYLAPEDYEATCNNGVDEFKKGIEAIEWEKAQFEN